MATRSDTDEQLDIPACNVLLRVSLQRIAVEMSQYGSVFASVDFAAPRYDTLPVQHRHVACVATYLGHRYCLVPAATETCSLAVAPSPPHQRGSSPHGIEAARMD